MPHIQPGTRIASEMTGDYCDGRIIASRMRAHIHVYQLYSDISAQLVSHWRSGRENKNEQKWWRRRRLCYSATCHASIEPKPAIPRAVRPSLT